MGVTRVIRRFFFPALTLRFIMRLAIVTLTAYLFFGQICIPFRVKGYSMEPTYRDGDLSFCWRLRYALSPPERHDVVAVRLAGHRVFLLKRVVGLQGEHVEFCHGELIVDGIKIEEPYVSGPYDWNLGARAVKKGCVYVVGDNRNMPMENHYFGQTSVQRIVGGPLW